MSFYSFVFLLVTWCWASVCSVKRKSAKNFILVLFKFEGWDAALLSIQFWPSSGIFWAPTVFYKAQAKHHQNFYNDTNCTAYFDKWHHPFDMISPYRNTPVCHHLTGSVLISVMDLSVDWINTWKPKSKQNVAFFAHFPQFLQFFCCVAPFPIWKHNIPNLGNFSGTMLTVQNKAAPLLTASPPLLLLLALLLLVHLPELVLHLLHLPNLLHLNALLSTKMNPF